jgi:selenocysteine lyase/cysteine desulfurase
MYHQICAGTRLLSAITLRSPTGPAVAPRQLRAPHMIGIVSTGGLPEDLPNRLAQEKIFVSVRGNAIRIAPHLYTTETEIERLFNALQRALS